MNLKFLRKISLSLLFMLLASTILFAQDRKVTGKVVDQADGQGIPGVNVSLKGIPSNVSTNSDGNFTIQVKSDDDVLVFSFIGYVRQQIKVGKQTNIAVRLVSENKSLEDVVVVGYGTQKRSHLTGAVVDIKAAEVEDLPASNIGAALAGKILGVGVSGGISRPGSTAKLTIRNPNTIFSKDGGSTDPLYVIDDVIQINPQNGQPDATLFQ
ncbi:carboxypeptidase-like regulatory domain-containing protein [Pedobacter sp. P26]|uniref:carboxypeptidase-like regulatory domain-containing protein n=1 Tax=Pedobacter sp. P26 TaxID=3423956 RepID=UPI003D67DD3F